MVRCKVRGCRARIAPCWARAGGPHARDARGRYDLDERACATISRAESHLSHLIPANPALNFLLIHEAQQGCRDATYEPSRFPVAVPYPSPHRATPAYVVVTSSDLDTSRNKASVSGLSWISRLNFKYARGGRRNRAVTAGRHAGERPRACSACSNRSPCSRMRSLASPLARGRAHTTDDHCRESNR